MFNEWYPKSFSGTWKQCAHICDMLIGYRMPTDQELENALDRSKSQPATEVIGFLPEIYWSSIPCINNGETTSYYWVVHFNNGYVASKNGSDICYVRPIQD